jgi:hypothetical protein
MLIPALIGVFIAAFVVLNPLLFGLKTGVPHDKFTVFQHNPILDMELSHLKHAIAPQDYEPYRNHCLRVLTFAMYHLPESVKDEIPNALEIIAMALAFHDVGLWTDKKLNYLEPSAERMAVNVAEEEERSWTPKDIRIAKAIIMEHHKVTPYTEGATQAENDIVNAVRKGDWADATMGLVRYGTPAALMEAAYAKVPEAGFHWMLAGMGKRLSPDSLRGQLEVLKIIRW